MYHNLNDNNGVEMSNVYDIKMVMKALKGSFQNIDSLLNFLK